jgi:O-methyltransferase
MKSMLKLNSKVIKLNSNSILEKINPPEKVISVEHMNELINDSKVLTLIEKDFFIQVKSIIEEIIVNKVEGDLVFVGTYRGGGALYIKSLFEELGFKNKCWLFDSFDGFNPNLLNDQENKSINLFTTKGKFNRQPTERSVWKLFEKNNLAHNLEVVKGYIEETIYEVSIEKIAFLHLDLDIFSSTLIALKKFYPKISKYGWVVVDDYYVSLFQCRLAVDQFRENNLPLNPITKIGNYPAGWSV